MTLAERQTTVLQFQPLLGRIARRMCCQSRTIFGQDEPEEWRQELSLCVFQALEHYDESRGALRPFIETAARCQVLDLCRRFYVRREYSRRLAPEKHGSGSSEYSQARELVLAALGTLPEKERATLQAYYWEDKSYAEISREQGVQPSVAWQRQKRGLVKLRRVLRRRDIHSSAALY